MSILVRDPTVPRDRNPAHSHPLQIGSFQLLYEEEGSEHGKDSSRFTDPSWWSQEKEALSCPVSIYQTPKTNSYRLGLSQVLPTAQITMVIGMEVALDPMFTLWLRDETLQKLR